MSAFLLNPATWDIALKLLGLLGGVFVARKVTTNAKVNRAALLVSLAEQAWGATETWKKAQKDKPDGDQAEAYFFTKMGAIVYAKKMSSMTQNECLFLSAWVRLRSSAAKSK